MKANEVSINLIPKKSRYRYERQYDRLTNWCNTNKYHILMICFIAHRFLFGEQQYDESYCTLKLVQSLFVLVQYVIPHSTSTRPDNTNLSDLKCYKLQSTISSIPHKNCYFNNTCIGMPKWIFLSIAVNAAFNDSFILIGKINSFIYLYHIFYIVYIIIICSFSEVTQKAH